MPLPQGRVMRRIPLVIVPLLLLGLPFSLHYPFLLSSSQEGSSATNKLQLMNLKAGAQSIGLEISSIGWEILEKLVAEHDNNQEWTDIWNALTIGKVPSLHTT
jgi:hypothetical protein